jgi:putative glutamine amidotransferase
MLVRGAGERDLPCLGICRGMQVVNVAYGGSLEQHLADRLDDDIHRGAEGEFADHRVDVEPESLAALAAGATRVDVKSYHHQGVARVGDGLHVTARAEGDGTVEAIEDARRRFMLGVLWHPEEDEADRLIGAFVRECAGGPDRSGPPVRVSR